MSNTYFNFKQFSIQQDKCAMKVGTDGVLLGAWASVEGLTRALDIGTGTGLIALMLAQRCPGEVDGVEIEPAAAAQAAENVKNSPWASRVKIFSVPIQRFAPETPQKYDAVVCNPPFFHDSYEAKDKERTLARHLVSLTHEELVKMAANLLTKKGRLSIIIPYQVHERFGLLANRYNLYAQRLTKVYPTPLKRPHRILAEFGFSECKNPKTSSLVIEENGRHQYSPEYKKLTGEFYL